MDENQIIKQINYEIDNWQSKMVERNIYVQLSPKAKKFIIELIENIQEDQSEYWRLKTASESMQNLAMARIPEALDIVIRQKRLIFQQEAYISSWEIWNVLSRILIRFCFIPEKDM
ncbi:MULTISPECIES: hypothetical protein [unclassified Flavobacterium]|uniref:hypothetical protein n=1 Tax=unclassified Flavobacterium TaxID=196869 RepID=UPI000963863B|nr:MULTISPECIES: hypothetical protein [unclassified Flavobacterium]MBN9285597.1 hypothetical protein [Flavobacterium sp.]OJV71047.1 MAG: hypothetical protein BGO42_04330 [Flavobacterium sp. 40-81]